MSLDILLQRAVSGFSLSIGTALALESIFAPMQQPYDPNRSIPQQVNLSDYQEFWINLSTLFRNLIGSIPAADMLRVTAGDCSTVLLHEMSVIDELVKNTNSFTKMQFYLCEHNGLDKHFPLAQIRIPTTNKQKHYVKLHDDTLKKVFKNYNGIPQSLKTTNYKVEPDSRVKALILTHVALDLIRYMKFDTLHLIESHTGLLKKRNLWYTKYYQGKNLTMMPFNHGLLQFYGDNEVFHPFKLSARETILKLAKEKHWTPMTTNDKIIMDIQRVNDPFLVSVLKSLFTFS